jgi:hypothetical protein
MINTTNLIKKENLELGTTFEQIPDPFQENISIETQLLWQLKSMQAQMISMQEKILNLQETNNTVNIKLSKAVQDLANQQGNYSERVSKAHEAVQDLTVANNKLSNRLEEVITEGQLGSSDSHLSSIDNTSTSDSDRVKRMAKHIQDLTGLLEDEKNKPRKGGIETMPLEEVEKLTGDRRTAARSYSNMNQGLRKENIVPKGASKKRPTEFTSDSLPPETILIEATSSPKSRLDELYEAVSNYKNPILHSHAVLLCQESEDKLTPEQLTKQMETAVLIFNDLSNRYQNEKSIKDLQSLITQEIKSSYRSKKAKKETMPEVPKAVFQFIDYLKCETACDPNTLGPEDRIIYIKNKKLLRIAFEISNSESFFVKSTNITYEDFKNRVQNRYDWEYDSGKAIKQSVVKSINFFRDRISFISNKKKNVVVSESIETSIPVPTIKVAVDPSKHVEPLAEYLGEPSDVAVDKTPIGNLADVSSVQSSTIKPAELRKGDMVDVKSNTGEITTPNCDVQESTQKQKTMEQQKTSIKNSCNQFISVLEIMDAGGNNFVGFQKLIEHSNRTDFISHIENMAQQLNNLKSTYNNTPDIRKLSLLTAANKTILEHLAKFPAIKIKEVSGSKKHPPLTSIHDLISPRKF